MIAMFAAAVLLLAPVGTVNGSGEGRTEILLSPGTVARTGREASVRVTDSSPGNPMMEVTKGRVLVEVMPIGGEQYTSVEMGGKPFRLDHPGLYEFNADQGTAVIYKGKLQGAQRGDRKLARQDPLYTWSKARSRMLAAASWPTAREVFPVARPWRGGGWFWNAGLGLYTFLPDDGCVESPFGWTYESPYEEFAPRRPGLAFN